MAIYTLTFDVSAAFSAGMPKLQIKFGGVKLDTTYVGAGSSTLSYQIDTDGPFDHSLLRFYFVKNYGSGGDTIDISNVRLNGDPVDLSAFTHNKGSSGNASSISLTQGSYSDYNAQTDIPEVPPLEAAPAATITGTGGNDTLYGTDSADNIDGLAGNDRLYGGDGIDTINGGNGNDIISGQNGNDILNGNANDDRIYGNAGNDQINGGTGNDRLYGNDGIDTIYGYDGDDFVWGGNDGDSIYGEAGNDRLSGEAGDDYIEGGTGTDQLFGGDGNDELHGGDNNDRILGNNGNDILYGDDGDDNIDGQLGDDTIYGGADNDTIDGEQGNDNLNGDGGNDTIMGGQGSDIINGGAGDDILHGGGISSYDQYVIREGSAWGRSEVWYSEATNSFYRFVNANVNFATAESAAASATLNGAAGHLVTITSQIENDFVRVMMSDNSWTAAQDINQNGTWEWSAGREDGITFSDVAGNSLYSGYENWDAGQPQNNAEYWGVMYTNGTWHDWPGTSGHSYVIEWDGEDVQADLSSNTINGGDGNDLIYGGSGIDTIHGDNHNDRIFGNDGNDLLYGDNGDDMLSGGAGTDTIYGNLGDDYINGGAGNDTIYGSDFTDIDIAGAGSVISHGGSQDGAGFFNVMDDGVGVELTGNLWKKLLVNYTITANTVLEFDFSSGAQGEIHAIGFDTDNNISDNLSFKLHGTQNWGRTNFDNYDGSGNWTHYEINVGSFFTGTYSHLTLINDHDVGSPTAESFFRNIILHEGNVDTNTVNGGDGVDDLYAGGGTEIFAFDSTAFSGIDRLHNFSEGDGDILDLSDIITGFSGTITDYVQLTDSGDHSILSIDANGLAGGSSFTNIAEIRGGEGLDVSTLYGNGQIIV